MRSKKVSGWRLDLFLLEVNPYGYFFYGLYRVLCRLCSLDLRSFVDRHKPGIPTGMLLSVMVIECCVSLFI